jgi:hypothetical protein
MPWIDRQSIDAYVQMIVDDIVYNMMIGDVSKPPLNPSNDTADRLPIYNVCNDDFIANIYHTIQSTHAKKKRLIFLSNVVYNCLTTAMFDNIPLSHYLFTYRDTVIDYLYVNDRKQFKSFLLCAIDR